MLNVPKYKKHKWRFLNPVADKKKTKKKQKKNKKTKKLIIEMHYFGSTKWLVTKVIK